MARFDKATGMLTRGTYLKYSATQEGEYTIIPDLQEIPDLGQEPETVEVTTLEDGAHRYIDGLKDTGGSIDFTFLYGCVEGSGYKVCRGIEKLNKTHFFKIVLPDGTEIAFSGKLTTRIPGFGTNAAVQFTASIAVGSDFVVTESPDGQILAYNEGIVGA